MPRRKALGPGSEVPRSPGRCVPWSWPGPIGGRDLGRDDPVSACRALLSCARTVAVKLGRDGCCVAGPDLPGPATIAPNKPLKALDTTGAGDSFDAAFVLCMLRGLTPADAGKLANTWASGTIMRLGARTDRRMSNGLSLYDVGGIVE